MNWDTDVIVALVGVAVLCVLVLGWRASRRDGGDGPAPSGG